MPAIFARICAWLLSISRILCPSSAVCACTSARMLLISALTNCTSAVVSARTFCIWVCISAVSMRVCSCAVCIACTCRRVSSCAVCTACTCRRVSSCAVCTACTCRPSAAIAARICAELSSCADALAASPFAAHDVPSAAVGSSATIPFSRAGTTFGTVDTARPAAAFAAAVSTARPAAELATAVPLPPFARSAGRTRLSRLPSSPPPADGRPPSPPLATGAKSSSCCCTRRPKCSRILVSHPEVFRR